MESENPKSPGIRRLWLVVAATLSCASTLLTFEGLLRANALARPVAWMGYNELIDSRFLAGGLLRPAINGLALGPGRSSVPWITNHQGFRNTDPIPDTPKPGTLRILSMGDSFTVGYRLARKDTYSAHWERWLRKRGQRDSEVLISLVEDPVQGLFYLSRFGQRFEPDVAILGITLGNDIAQAYVRLDPRGDYRLNPAAPGGIERSDPDEFLGFAHGLEDYMVDDACLEGDPRSQPASVSQRSAVVGLVTRAFRRIVPPEGEAPASYYPPYEAPRLFDPNHGLGFFLRDPPPEILAGFERLFSALAGFQNVCREQGIRCAVMLFPQRFQVRAEDWDATVATYGLRPSCFDLAAPNRRILNFCRERGLRCLDPTNEMAAMSLRWGLGLYMPAGDMHWNALGNRAMFEASKLLVSELVAQAGGSSEIP